MNSNHERVASRRRFMLGGAATAVGLAQMTRPLQSSIVAPDPSAVMGEGQVMTASVDTASLRASLAPYDRILAAHDAVNFKDREKVPADADDPAALANDAEVAWTYFSMWRSGEKAFIPATAYEASGNVDGYPILTMWDAASLINAWSSAHILGLVTAAELQSFAGRIAASLTPATMEFRGGKLPLVEFTLNGKATGRVGFDSADAGRLLVALRILDNLTGSRAGIAALVKSWDFAPIIKNRRLQNVVRNRLQNFAINSYTHYTTEGFRLWGLAVDEVHDVDEENFGLEARAAFFARVAKRGRVATEPNATQAVELGSTPSLNFICDMLLAAQIARHEKTGILTCASEGIIDQTPWFTYQACQFRPQGEDQWVIDTSSKENTEIARAKGDALRTLSVKGAFLWHAIRPGAYSSKLVATARGKARTRRIGYASNIYEATLRPTNCSDINANGVILEALAYIKSGRRPLLDVSQELTASKAGAG
jgi:Protein of unknown function (DUF3131)